MQFCSRYATISIQMVYFKKYQPVQTEKKILIQQVQEFIIHHDRRMSLLLGSVWSNRR